MGDDAELIDVHAAPGRLRVDRLDREHALVFLYGTGANGKSDVPQRRSPACAGDYHRTAPIETFTASNSDRHPTDLAGLRGARS